MTDAGFWKDDAQVASEICEKFWADIPGVYVCVEEIDAEDSVENGKENALWQTNLR